MTDLEALYAAVVASPLEDTPRLMFADACDEFGTPEHAARAEFVRKQIELHNLGPAPHVIENALMVQHGPNYWEVGVGDSDGTFKVGDRVDVVAEELHKIKFGSKNQRFYGLLVMKVPPEPDGCATLVLKRDEHSKPYPIKQAESLRARCRKLLVSGVPVYWRRWTPEFDLKLSVRVPSGDPDAWFTVRVVYPVPAFPDGLWTFERGFISAVRCPWEHWHDFGDKLVASAPISRVEFTDIPEWDVNDDGVTVAGRMLSWPAIPDGPANEDDGVILTLRWPTIPAANWTLPADDE